MFSRIILFCLLALVCSCLNPENTNAERQIFIWTRYGGTKNSDLVKSLNRHGGTNSHIGLSFELDKPIIYNVDFIEHDTVNFLHKITRAKFDYRTNSTAVYGIIINLNQYERLQKRLQELLKKQISYDFNFSLIQDDSYYCSEFVYELLLAADGARFKYNPQKVKLAGITKLILGREDLNYIPADFFLSYKQTTKITIPNYCDEVALPAQ